VGKRLLCVLLVKVQREVDPARSRKEREFEVEELQVCVQLGGEALL
jgi:hypothetical protein